MENNLRQETVEQYAFETWAAIVKAVLGSGGQNGDGSVTIPLDTAQMLLSEASFTYETLPDVAKKYCREEADKILRLMETLP